MKKVISIALIAVSAFGTANAVTSPGMTIGDSVRSAYESSNGYLLSDSDKKLVDNAVSRVEAVIKSKGEPYRPTAVRQLKNAAKKYPNSPRMVAIVSVTADHVASGAGNAPTEPQAVTAVPGNAGKWTVVGGGDCSSVSNAKGNDGDTSVCTDNREYKMQGGATHDRTYDLVKVAGNWWFNENLAYPLPTGYQGRGTWHDKDSPHYSCPGPLDVDRDHMDAEWNAMVTESHRDLWATIPDCGQVAKKGYLYQWSAAMAGSGPSNDKSKRARGICPNGWALPTKYDFSTKSSAYWPDQTTGYDGESIDMVYRYGGNAAGWRPTYAGTRTTDEYGLDYLGVREWLWSSSLDQKGKTVVTESFDVSFPNKSRRAYGSGKNYNFASVRCIKQ